MSREIIINIIRFVFLILLQVFVLNNIDLGGYLNPYLYVVFILLLPFDTPKWLLLISAFAMGLCIDIFMETVGINIAATVFMAWARPGTIKFLSRGRDIEAGDKPGIRDFGFRWFFMYTLFLVFLHHLLLFFLETFKFTNFLQTLTKVGLNTLFTLFLIILFQYLIYRPKN